jgi:UDP-glucose 4-epimerase
VRYLITGGAGFIGSHLTEALVARGDNVTILDNLSTGRAENLSGLEGHSNVKVVLGSVLDQLLVDELVHSSDVVVHLAAAVGVRNIVEHPLRSFVTNIRGSEHILEAAHRYSRKVLIASTSEIYGKNEGLLDENSDRILGSPAVARWAYSTSKAADEILALAYWRERGLPTVIVRLFNTVGPRQVGAYGMVLPRFVAQALLGEDLTIYGTGDQSRCFCDVSDVVRALMGLLDDDRTSGEVFNIGSSEECTVSRLAERVIAAAGSSSGVKLVSYDEAYGPAYEDMLRRVPDTTKVRAQIGWEPQLDLDATIRRVLIWVRSAGPERVLGREPQGIPTAHSHPASR